MRHVIRVQRRAAKLDVYDPTTGFFLPPSVRKALDKTRLKPVKLIVQGEDGKAHTQTYWVRTDTDDQHGVEASDMTTAWKPDRSKTWWDNLLDFARVRAKEIFGVEFTSLSTAPDENTGYYGYHQNDGAIFIRKSLWDALGEAFKHTIIGGLGREVHTGNSVVGHAMKTYLHEHLHGAGAHKHPGADWGHYIKDDTGRVLQEGAVELLSQLSIARFYAPFFKVDGGVRFKVEKNPGPEVPIRQPTSFYRPSGVMRLTQEEAKERWPDRDEAAMKAAGWEKRDGEYGIKLVEDKLAKDREGRPLKHYKTDFKSWKPLDKFIWVKRHEGKYSDGEPWQVDWDEISYNREVALTLHLVGLAAGHKRGDERVDSPKALGLLKELCFGWVPVERPEKLAAAICAAHAPPESEYRRDLRVRAVRAMIEATMDSEKLPSVVADAVYEFASWVDEDDHDDTHATFMQEIIDAAREKLGVSVLKRQIDQKLDSYRTQTKTKGRGKNKRYVTAGAKFSVSRYAAQSIGAHMADLARFPVTYTEPQREQVKSALAAVLAKHVRNYAFKQEYKQPVSSQKLSTELVAMLDMEHTPESVMTLDSMVPDLYAKLEALRDERDKIGARVPAGEPTPPEYVRIADEIRAMVSPGYTPSPVDMRKVRKVKRQFQGNR